MIRTLHITANGRAEVVTVDPILANFRDMVGGGYIEGINGEAWWGQWSGYCDEEGKLKGQPVNMLATSLAIDSGWVRQPGDVLVGDVVFFGPPDSEGMETDVSATLTAMLAAIVEPDPSDLP